MKKCCFQTLHSPHIFYSQWNTTMQRHHQFKVPCKDERKKRMAFFCATATFKRSQRPVRSLLQVAGYLQWHFLLPIINGCLVFFIGLSTAV